MAVQFSVGLRNAMLDTIETFGGTSPILRLRTGAAPADCATADSGTVVSTINLPSDWLADAASGAKAKSGTWQDTSADASGTMAHWRLYTSGGVCFAQGTITNTSGGGDLTVDNVAVNAGQQITITSWQFNAGNA